MLPAMGSMGREAGHREQDRLRNDDKAPSASRTGRRVVCTATYYTNGDESQGITTVMVIVMRHELIFLISSVLTWPLLHLSPVLLEHRCVLTPPK